MTDTKVIAVLAMYRDKVLQLWPNAKPERMNVHRSFPWGQADNECWNHLFYMCVEAMDFAAHGRMEKAFRWLGFIQGVFATWGIYSIDEMGKHNMPDTADEPPRAA